MYENTNISTGIRFGVLSVRIVEPNWAYEEFYNHAESIQWNEKIEELKELIDSIHAFADEHGLDQKQEIEDLHQSILSDLSDTGTEFLKFAQRSKPCMLYGQCRELSC